MLDYIPLLLALFIGVLAFFANRQLKYEKNRRDLIASIPEGYREIWFCGRGALELQRDGEDAWICRVEVFAPSYRHHVFHDVIVHHNGIDITDKVKSAQSSVMYDHYYEGHARLKNDETIHGNIRIYARYDYVRQHRSLHGVEKS